jgi:hypothetical protein
VSLFQSHARPSALHGSEKEVGFVLRVLFSPKDVAPWVLSEDELLSQVDRLAETGFAGAPVGMVTVEAVDELGRIQWLAHYASAADLAILARHIREGRKALASRRAKECP